MKKLTRLLAVCASLLAFAFVGCNSSIDDATVSGGELKETKTLKIYATSQDDVIYFSNNGARTITPAAIDGSNSAYHFFLSGKNLTKNETLKKSDKDHFEVSFVHNTGSTTEGIVNVDLDVANYELTLEVTKNSTYDAADVILTAKAYADLRYNESIRFFLMPATSGSGKVQIKLYTDGWKLSDYSGYKAIAKITKLDTDEDLSTELKKEHTTLGDGTSTSAVDFITTQPATVTAGTYNFVVEFTNTIKSFYWSDRIVVLPNQTTEATIAIPKVIGVLPAAPANLYVGYKVPDTDDSMYYTAEFNWEDKSNNEQNFQLDILDISNVSDDAKITGVTAYTDFGTTGSEEFYSFAIAKVMGNDTSTKASDTKTLLIDAAWTVLSDTAKSKAAVYAFDSSVYQIKDTNQAGGITYNEGDGTTKSSLTKNNKQLALNLPLGKRYLARISAVNAAGNSPYAYAVIEGTSANTTAYASVAKFGTQLWPEKATSINVYKITYNLVGGSFYDATYPTASTVTKSSTNVTDKIKTTTPAPTTLGGYTINKANNTIIQFDCQSSETTKAVIINPLKITYETGKTAALFKGDNKWVSWKKESTTSSDIYATETDSTKPLTAYKGSDNLNLYAAYSSATAKIYNPEDYKIKDADVKLQYGASATYASTFDSFTNGGTIKIYDTDGTTVKYSHLFILVKNDSKYSNIQVQLKETNGTIVGTYKSTGKETVGGTTTYTAQSTKPGTFTAEGSNYAKNASGDAFASESEWNAASEWYKIETTGSSSYDVFVIPTQEIKTTSFQATIQAYAGITTNTPYTYPVIFTVTE